MSDEFPDVTTDSDEGSLESRAMGAMRSLYAFYYFFPQKGAPFLSLEGYEDDLSLIRDWCTAELQEIDRRKHGPQDGF